MISFYSFAILQMVVVSPIISLVSTYINICKMGVLVGGITHASISGIGIVHYINYKFNTQIPLFYGMLMSSIFISLLIFILTKKEKENTQTITNALWSIGVSVGMFCIYKTPNSINLESYLFGKNIFFNTLEDLYLLIFIGITLLLFYYFFHKNTVYLAFDEEFLKTKNVNIDALYLIILLTVCVVITVLVYNFGIMMVVSLTSLPFIISNYFLSDLKKVMILCTLLTLATNLISLLISSIIDIPVSLLIIFILSSIYLLYLIVSKFKFKF